MQTPGAGQQGTLAGERAAHNSMSMNFCGAQLEGGRGQDRGSPDASGTTCAAELSPRDSLGLKRKNNSLAQRRYRARQKQKTEGLQETLQQLASKVSELEVVKKACAMLQVQCSVFMAVTRRKQLVLVSPSCLFSPRCMRALDRSTCGLPVLLEIKRIPSYLLYGGLQQHRRMRMQMQCQAHPPLAVLTRPQ